MWLDEANFELVCLSGGPNTFRSQVLTFEKIFFMNIAKWSDGPLGTEIRPTWPENRPTLYFLLVIWTFIDRERSERGTSHEGLDSVAHTSSSV